MTLKPFRLCCFVPLSVIINQILASINLAKIYRIFFLVRILHQLFPNFRASCQCLFKLLHFDLFFWIFSFDPFATSSSWCHWLHWCERFRVFCRLLGNSSSSWLSPNNSFLSIFSNGFDLFFFDNLDHWWMKQKVFSGDNLFLFLFL